MADKFSLRYLPVAVDDLSAIFDWIAHDRPATAETFLRELDRRMRNLKAHPFLGRVPRDEKLKDFGYRILVIGSYLVFYVVRSSTIEIHRVIHGSRNLDAII
jgi:toxin ParE1/3/4